MKCTRCTLYVVASYVHVQSTEPVYGSLKIGRCVYVRKTLTGTTWQTFFFHPTVRTTENYLIHKIAFSQKMGYNIFILIRIQILMFSPTTYCNWVERMGPSPWCGCRRPKDLITLPASTELPHSSLSLRLSLLKGSCVKRARFCIPSVPFQTWSCLVLCNKVSLSVPLMCYWSIRSTNLHESRA
jgi:hypothetical protein